MHSIAAALWNSESFGLIGRNYAASWLGAGSALFTTLLPGRSGGGENLGMSEPTGSESVATRRDISARTVTAAIIFAWYFDASSES